MSPKHSVLGSSLHCDVQAGYIRGQLVGGRVWGLRFHMQGFRVWGLGFRVQAGCRQGLVHFYAKGARDEFGKGSVQVDDFFFCVCVV